MTKMKFSGDFNSNYRKLIEDDPLLQDIIADTIKIFEKNTSDTRLHNHQLRKRMKGKWAFSVTEDIRIVYEWTGKETVRFLAIGTHEDVYQ